MKNRTLEDLKEHYLLDLNLVVKKIKEKRAKFVLLQFPDGLKPYSTSVVDYLEEKTSSTFFIFLGDCYGACDTPLGLEGTEIDLIVQFGHNSFMPVFLK